MKLSQKSLKKLLKVFKNFPQVLVVYLFGSQAKDFITPLSDIDLAVLTKNILDLDQRASLIGVITSALETDQVDVVFLNQSQSASLRFRIISEGEILYCSSEKKRVEFEEKVITEYQLLKPFLDTYDKYFFEEVKSYGRR